MIVYSLISPYFPPMSNSLPKNILTGILLLTVFSRLHAGNLSVSPSSGPGNALVSASASGFQPDPISGTVYANTGFYADDGFIIGCPGPSDGSGWGNCTVMIRMPTGVGPHVIRASNSFGEVATTTFTVAAPGLTIAPAFGPVGTRISCNGKLFAAAANVGLYIEGGLYLNVPTDESGGFTTNLIMPPIAAGPHDIVGLSGAASASATFTLTNCIGSVAGGRPGGTLTPPGGSPQPLAPGVPVPVLPGDTIRTAAGGSAPLTLVDGTQFKLGQNTATKVDQYAYDPQNPSADSAHYLFFGGAMEYVSGLITKVPNPDVNLDTGNGFLGVRGTQFIVRQDLCSTTQEIYLIEGRLDVTPHATPGQTNVCLAPLTIYLTATNLTTSPLSQATYDSVSNEIFNAAAGVTFASWLTQYFGCTNANAAAAPTADPDGDGQDNQTEFLAGTDPTSAASAFRLTSARAEGPNLRLNWTCGPGRTNLLQTTTNLTGPWTDLAPPIILANDYAGDIATNYLHLGALTQTPSRYYRIRLVP